MKTFPSTAVAKQAIYSIRIYDSHRGVTAKDLRVLQVSPKRWTVIRIHPNGNPEVVPEDEIEASEAARAAISTCRAFGEPFPRVVFA